MKKKDLKSKKSIPILRIDMDTEYWLKVCKGAGEKVFTEIKKILENEDRKKILKVGFSGDKTLLIDDVAERTIFEHFKSTGKSFKFISEEIGIKTIGSKPEVIVVVDPVDGSNNMNYGLPIASTSIAVGDLSEKISGIKVGYVKDIILGNDYYAIESKGSFKNGKKINVIKEKIGCILVDIAREREKNFQRIVRVGANFRSLRMTGSSTLQMCQFAEGVADGHIVLGSNRTLDFAASQLIAREAGAIIKDLDGNNFTSYQIGINMNVNLIAVPNDEMYLEIRKLMVD